MSLMMLDIVRAMRDVPEVWINVDQYSGSDLIYKVGYVQSGVVIPLGAFAHRSVAVEIRDSMQQDLRVRAAIFVMKKMSPEVERVGLEVSDHAPRAFRAMLDEIVRSDD